ncbi:MAG: Hsp70 family protein, partial [Myxococcota bacterium]
MSRRPLHIGIDLGTTNSAVAAFDGEQLQLVRNRHGSFLTPSVVRIDARGNVGVGERARRMLDEARIDASWSSVPDARRIEKAALKRTRRALASRLEAAEELAQKQ